MFFGLISSNAVENTVDTLKTEGEALLGMFTKTMDGLKNLNEKIIARRQYHAGQAEQHQKDHDHLLNQEARNNKVIEKISQLLSL